MIDCIEIEYNLEELNVLKEDLERPSSSKLLIVNSEEKSTNRYFINLFEEACNDVNTSEIYGEINFLIPCARCRVYVTETCEFAFAPYDDNEYRIFNELIEKLKIACHSIKYVLQHIEWCTCKK